MLGGDGIGPSIAHESQRVLESLLEDQVSSGRVSFRTIDGLTIERRAEEMAAIPEGVLKEIHECDVTLKGPTTTPEQGDGWPNIESANVAMRQGARSVRQRAARFACRRKASTGPSSARTPKTSTRLVPKASRWAT